MFIANSLDVSESIPFFALSTNSLLFSSALFSSFDVKLFMLSVIAFWIFSSSCVLFIIKLAIGLYNINVITIAIINANRPIPKFY